MIDIAYENQIDTVHDDYETLFKQLAQVIFLQQNMTQETEVSVTIVDLDTIQTLNRDYRNLDQPTDVISFAFNDAPDNFLVPEDYVSILGDIVICYDKAVQQALEYGHSLKREMAFLFVHGLLHLLGYDHMSPQEEKQMFTLQEAVLHEANIPR